MTIEGVTTAWLIAMLVLAVISLLAIGLWLGSR